MTRKHKGLLIIQQVGTFELIKSWLIQNSARLDLYIYPEIQQAVQKSSAAYKVLQQPHLFQEFDLSGYDFLICGTLSYNAHEHADFVNYAKLKGLRTFLLIDNWSYMPERFLYPCEPEAVLVIDEVMSEMVKKHTAAPTIEIGLKSYESQSQKTTTPRISFITEPYHSRTADYRDDDFDSFDIFINFLAQLNQDQKPFVAQLRPHPRDTDARIETFIRLANQKSLTLHIDRASKDDSLKNNDFVVGLTSMYLIESSLSGIKTVSVPAANTPSSPTTTDRFNIRIARTGPELIYLYENRFQNWPGHQIKTGQTERILNTLLFKEVTHV